VTGTRRLDLDGLRGLAVLLVVGFHAGVPALRGAFVAVDVFFVLSGFFLATTLARSLATGEEIRPAELVARRAWRLLPVLVVVLLGTLATTLLYAPIDRAAVVQHMVPVSMFAGNLAFAAEGVNYFRAGENPLLHSWTLGIELQLALLLPLLVMLFAGWGERRAGKTEPGAERRWIVLRTVLLGLALVGALSFALAVVINDSAPMWAYFGPHTRFWSFCAGALMAFVTGGGQSAVGSSSGRLAAVQLVGLGLLFAPALFFEGTLAYPGVVALAPVAGTMCLLAGGGLAVTSMPGRLLASAPLVALGRVSYAWYLWHWPLMVLGGVMMPSIGVGGKLAWGFAGLLAALLTHRLFERPGTAALLNRAMTGRPLLTAAGVSAALALLAIGAVRSNERYVDQSVHRRYVAARNDDMGHGCWGRVLRQPSRAGCAFGLASSSTTIGLIGDSHASHWLGGLERAGQAYGWKIDAYVMGACPVADLRGLIDGAAARLYRTCAGFQEQTMRRLATERPRAVILSNSDNYLNAQGGLMGVPGLSESVWTEGLRRTYARLDRLGIEVIVLRGLPWVPFDVPSCLSRRAARLPLATECEFAPNADFMARARRIQDRAARGLPVRFIDMNDQVCGVSPGRCATERGGIVLFTDDNHITRSFSRSLGPVLGERLDAALRR
jgi:peptidoglycan/LPS O-acetylase OafA/YrhL